MKINIDEKRLIGALIVLKNYIDGALADYENGDVENTSVLEDCIYVHRMLDVANCFVSGWTKDEYQERFEKKQNELKGDERI